MYFRYNKLWKWKTENPWIQLFIQKQDIPLNNWRNNFSCSVVCTLGLLEEIQIVKQIVIQRLYYSSHYSLSSTPSMSLAKPSASHRTLHWTSDCWAQTNTSQDQSLVHSLHVENPMDDQNRILGRIMSRHEKEIMEMANFTSILHSGGFTFWW